MRPRPPKKYLHYRWHWLRADGAMICAVYTEKWGWSGVPLDAQCVEYWAPAIPPAERDA